MLILLGRPVHGQRYAPYSIEGGHAYMRSKTGLLMWWVLKLYDMFRSSTGSP